MSFSLPSGNVILQQDVDTSLSGIPSAGLQSITFDGLVTVYTLSVNHSIQVSGTLTINPEKEKLIGNHNNVIDVTHTGTLILGGIEETTVNGETFRRYQRGVALRCTRAPRRWFGFGAGTFPENHSIFVTTGGTFILQGATVHVAGNFRAHEGSTLYIEDGFMIVDDITTLPDDNIVVPLPSSRGYLSYIGTNDATFSNFYFNNGGELIFNNNINPSADSGVGSILTIDGMKTPKTGFIGYSPLFSKKPVFANRSPALTLTNTDIAKRGNFADISVSSELDDAIKNTTTTLVNTNRGTEVTAIASETGFDTRNHGVVRVYREIDFNVTNLQEDTITGGRIFVRDTNNTLRTALYTDANNVVLLSDFNEDPANTLVDFNTSLFDDRTDYTYSNPLFNGALSRSFFILSGTIKIPSGATGQNTTNDPATTLNNDIPWRWDLRGNTNVPGEDRFTFHVWHPEYNYLPVTTSLATGSTTIIQNIALIEDRFYANTQFSNNQITTLSGIYDHIKVTKSSNASEMELPTISTLHIGATGRTLDLGNYELAQGNVEYLDVDTVNERLTVNAITLAPTDIFNSITTTGNIDVYLLDVTKAYNLTANILVQADEFMDFPSTWVLNGTIHFDDSGTKQLNFPVVADTSGISLLRTAGDVTVRGRGAEAFASVVGDISFVVEMTISSDIAGDITIYDTSKDFTSPSAFDHHINTNQVVKFDASPGDSFVAVIGIPGRVGIPVAFTATDRSQTVQLTSTSLNIFGYDSTVDIGTQFEYSIATPPNAIDNGRYILTALQTGGNFDYSDTDRNSKFFGDLYGAKNSAGTKNLMNEVILHNYDLTRDTEIFTLDPISTIVSVNLPLFRASYDTVVPAMPFRFRADPVLAKIINSDYNFIISRNAIASFNEASGVFNEPNIIGALSSSMNMAANTITTTLIENDEPNYSKRHKFDII